MLMNLVIMRHGQAEARNRSHDSDADRNLTKEGSETLKNFISTIDPWFPKPEKIITSPTRRTQQTAEILCKHLKISPFIVLTDPMILNGSAGEIISFLEDESLPENLWIIGHQPTLGQFLCALIGLDVFKGFQFKPGDCAYVKFPDKPGVNQGRLISYASPDLIERNLHNDL